ncbi:unnamed protein product, partial [Iphiclides podalirius]
MFVYYSEYVQSESGSATPSTALPLKHVSIGFRKRTPVQMLAAASWVVRRAVASSYEKTKLLDDNRHPLFIYDPI